MHVDRRLLISAVARQRGRVDRPGQRVEVTDVQLWMQAEGIEIAEAVHTWWSRYSRRPGDVVVPGGAEISSSSAGGFSLSGASFSRNFSGSEKIGTGER